MNQKHSTKLYLYFHLDIGSERILQIS